MKANDSLSTQRKTRSTLAQVTRFKLYFLTFRDHLHIFVDQSSPSFSSTYSINIQSHLDVDVVPETMLKMFVLACVPVAML